MGWISTTRSACPRSSPLRPSRRDSLSRSIRTAHPPAPRKALPTSAVHRKTASADDRTIVVASPSTGDDDDDDDEPRTTVFNGITYVRRLNGSFKGKLVSPGKIITIEGQDYVEYCVLAKLSFI